MLVDPSAVYWTPSAVHRRMNINVHESINRCFGTIFTIQLDDHTRTRSWSCIDANSMIRHANEYCIDSTRVQGLIGQRCDSCLHCLSTSNSNCPFRKSETNMVQRQPVSRQVFKPRRIKQYLGVLVNIYSRSMWKCVAVFLFKTFSSTLSTYA